jgi:hypothetical protein
MQIKLQIIPLHKAPGAFQPGGIRTVDLHPTTTILGTETSGFHIFVYQPLIYIASTHSGTPTCPHHMEVSTCITYF